MRKTFNIAAFCINKNECWFFAKEFNCLFYKNIDSGKTEIYGPVPWESNKLKMLYKEMEYIDGKLYLIPFRARSIAVYDIAKKKFYKLELDSQIVSKSTNYFRAGLVYNKYIYAFGIHVPAIIVIDTTNDKVEYLTSWYEDVVGFLTSTSKALFRKQVVVIEDVAYVPMTYGNIILAVDLKEKKVDINRLDFKTSGYVGVTSNGADIFLAERDGRGLIGCWNYKSKEHKVLGYLEQSGGEVNKFITYTSSGIEVYYEKHDGSKVNNEYIRAAEYDCDCLLSNGQTTAFFCNDGNVLTMYNGVKRKIDISIEISSGDRDKLYKMGDFTRESKWYGIEQFVEELIEK